MMRLLAGLVLASVAFAQLRTVTVAGKSPVITLRVVFTTGAAADPADTSGLAHLTAAMLAGGGTKDLTYKQIVDAMFPMASSVTAQTDQEMTTFIGATHVDNLDAYYKLFRSMLLEPGWREDDFKRLKDDQSTPCGSVSAAITTRNSAKRRSTRRFMVERLTAITVRARSRRSKR